MGGINVKLYITNKCNIQAVWLCMELCMNSCERGNELLGSIKDKCLEQLCDC